MVSVLPTCVTLESYFSAPRCFICRIPEYWSVWSFPSPGDLPNPGTESESFALQADSLQSESTGKPRIRIIIIFLKPASKASSLTCLLQSIQYHLNYLITNTQLFQL